MNTRTPPSVLIFTPGMTPKRLLQESLRAHRPERDWATKPPRADAIECWGTPEIVVAGPALGGPAATVLIESWRGVRSIILFGTAGGFLNHPAATSEVKTPTQRETPPGSPLGSVIFPAALYSDASPGPGRLFERSFEHGTPFPGSPVQSSLENGILRLVAETGKDCGDTELREDGIIRGGVWSVDTLADEQPKIAGERFTAGVRAVEMELGPTLAAAQRIGATLAACFVISDLLPTAHDSLSPEESGRRETGFRSPPVKRALTLVARAVAQVAVDLAESRIS